MNEWSLLSNFPASDIIYKSVADTLIDDIILIDTHIEDIHDIMQTFN